jgi:hypothetical protein
VLYKVRHAHYIFGFIPRSGIYNNTEMRHIRVVLLVYKP